MASSATNTSTLHYANNGTNGSFNPHYPSPVSFKLEGANNYLGWQSLFLPFLRMNSLMGLVDGSETTPQKTLPDNTPNPAYDIWFKKDQALLGCILSSISEKLVSSVYGLDSSSKVWNVLMTRFSGQSRSRIAHLKRQLQTISQGSRTITDYLQAAKSLADQLAAAGKPIDDQDLISFILDGLQHEFNPFITSYNFASRDKELTIEDFTTELLSYEALIDSQREYLTSNTMSFALIANKQKASQPQKKRIPIHTNRPITNSQNVVPPNVQQHTQITKQNQGQNVTSNRPICQICGKMGHTALDCYHRFDFSYQGRHPPAELAAMVAESNAAYEHQVWYADSGANTHITSEAENLTHQQPFNGQDTVTVGESDRANITPREG